MAVTSNHHTRIRLAGEDPYLLSAYNDVLVFASATAKTVTVPSGGVTRVLFSPVAGADFYVRCDGSAAVIPTVDVVDGTASFPNPIERDVGTLATFSVIAATGTKLGLAWYRTAP